MIIVKFLMVALIGYLIGSIPFGLLISRRSAKVDVRQYGSGKTGATNVLRVAGKKAAVMVAGLDIAKGAIAVLLAGFIVGQDHVVTVNGNQWWAAATAQALTALTAIIGHKWPIFVRFKGGRGVATYLGGLLALCPAAALFSGEVLIMGAALTRYVSLGSIAAGVAAYAILIPLTLFDGFPVEYLLYTLAGAVFIIIMHRDNISRLLAGKERKLGEKS